MNIGNGNITQALEQCKQDLENFKNAKVKCGIIGRSGTGKSSLINAIVDEEVSAVGEIETTMKISEPIEHKGLLFYDLPGSSTVNFPMDTYIETMGIKNFDCVILVTSDRFFEDDLYLITEIAKLKIPVFPVRTKLDFSIDRALKRGITEEETYSSIYEDIKNSLFTTAQINRVEHPATDSSYLLYAPTTTVHNSGIVTPWVWADFFKYQSYEGLQECDAFISIYPQGSAQYYYFLNYYSVGVSAFNPQ